LYLTGAFRFGYKYWLTDIKHLIFHLTKLSIASLFLSLSVIGWYNMKNSSLERPTSRLAEMLYSLLVSVLLDPLFMSMFLIPLCQES
jgi:hypothetical protein